MYLEDWYKHRGAAQSKLQAGAQGINQNTIQIQSQPTSNSVPPHTKRYWIFVAKKPFFILLRVCAEKCMTLVNTHSRKTRFRLAQILYTM